MNCFFYVLHCNFCSKEVFQSKVNQDLKWNKKNRIVLTFSYFFVGGILMKYNWILVWVIMLHKLGGKANCRQPSYLLTLNMKYEIFDSESWPLENIRFMSSKLSKCVLGKIMSLLCHSVILLNTCDLFIL